MTSAWAEWSQAQTTSDRLRSATGAPGSWSPPRRHRLARAYIVPAALAMDQHFACPPIDVPERDLCDLAGAQAQPSQQQQDRIVTPATRRSTLTANNLATIVGSTPRGNERCRTVATEARPVKQHQMIPLSWHVLMPQHKPTGDVANICGSAARSLSRATKPITSAAVSWSKPLVFHPDSSRQEPPHVALVARDRPLAQAPLEPQILPVAREHVSDDAPAAITTLDTLSIDASLRRSNRTQEVSAEGARYAERIEFPAMHRRSSDALAPVSPRHNGPFGMKVVRKDSQWGRLSVAALGAVVRDAKASLSLRLQGS